MASMASFLSPGSTCKHFVKEGKGWGVATAKCNGRKMFGAGESACRCKVEEAWEGKTKR